MTEFKSATIILPVLNETDALILTVEQIERITVAADICEYLIVICEKTTPAAVRAVRTVTDRLGARSRVHRQVMPFVGGAIREAFDLARGTHVVMMSSDLETPPDVIPVFIKKARKHPQAIITASRWIKGGGFSGYHPLKLGANYLFQKTFSMLYGCELTDMTYGYRIFPARLLKAIQWEELKHPFFLETIIKPIRLGVEVHEVPAFWVARESGESANSFFENFKYFKIASRVLRYSPDSILKPDASYPW